MAWAVRDLNFEIAKTGIVGLLGSNGAGKSTLMNALCGVLQPTEGDIHIGGANVRTEPLVAKRNIGFLPQQAPLYPELTVDEYLRYCANLRQVNRRDIVRRVSAAEEKCGLTHMRHRLIANLSGGYRQRVGIAQAILHSPSLVVLDEPTNGLDPNQIVEIRKLVKEIGAEQTVLLSTHILEEVKVVCEDILMIELGKFVFSGSMHEFHNLIEPSSMLLTLENPPSTEMFQSIEGVVNADQISERVTRLTVDRKEEISERLIARCAQEGWKLQEIHFERPSMSDVFAQLSKGTG